MIRIALPLLAGAVLLACRDQDFPTEANSGAPSRGSPQLSLTVLGTTDIGSFNGHVDVTPSAVNHLGQIAGFAHSGTTTESFLWQNGSFIPLGITPGAEFGLAFDLNDRPQVVGLIRITSGVEHAFLWQNGIMNGLGTLGGTSSQAYAINNRVDRRREPHALQRVRGRLHMVPGSRNAGPPGSFRPGLQQCPRHQ